MDIHNQARVLERENVLLKKAKIPEENKRLIEEFQRELIIQGIKTPRIVRYTKTLRTVCERWKNKPFREWTVEDVKDVLYSIETGGYNTKAGYKRYSIQTINEFKKGLRKFFKWLNGKNWEGLEPLRGEKKDERKPDILTEDEILKLIEVTNHPRDKALIAVGYEAGLRIGELASLQIKHIMWNVNGAKVKVHGKTGERVIPIVMAAPYLRRWLDHHPLRDDPEAYVFIGIGSKNYGRPMTYQAFAKVIKQAAKKVGIKKRIYPHILRHSRATVLANYLTEAQMNIFFGWVQGSNMPAVYVHLSGRDIDKAINRIYGIEAEETDEREEVAKPIKCPRCGHVNAPTDRYCGRCALILDERERLRLEMEESKVAKDLMEIIMRNPEMFAQIKEMIEFVERVRENPELMEVLRQLRDESIHQVENKNSSTIS